MTDWKLCPSCEGQAALRPFCDVCEGTAKVQATSPLFIEGTPMIDSIFRKILPRLSQPRAPGLPDSAIAEMNSALTDLRRYLIKAEFSCGGDRHAALMLIVKIAETINGRDQ
jgi:hypothetical protein